MNAGHETEPLNPRCHECSMTLKLEPERIASEQRASLTVLKALGAEGKLTQVRDSIWGAGDVEVAVGVIDLFAVPSETTDYDAPTDTWSYVINEHSYIRTLSNKLEASKMGMNDPKKCALSLNLDPHRFRGWAGVSLVIFYPDIAPSSVPSGIACVDYSRCGPSWYTRRKELTIATYQSNLIDAPRSFSLDVFSEKLNVTLPLAESPNPEEAINYLLERDLEARRAEDGSGKKQGRITDISLSRALQLSPIFEGSGLKPNTHSQTEPGNIPLLYEGVLEKQMAWVEKRCNDPYYNEDDRFSRVEFLKDVSLRPRPYHNSRLHSSIPNHLNEPLRWIIDQQLVSVR